MYHSDFINLVGMKTTIYIFLTIIILSACKKVLDIDIAESEKKIVVNGIFKADSAISIHVSKSMDILDTVKWYDLPIIENADIKIYSNNELLNIDYLAYGFYDSDHLAIPGNNYQIVIDAPPLNQVTAEVEMPQKIEISSIDTSSNWLTNSS